MIRIIRIMPADDGRPRSGPRVRSGIPATEAAKNFGRLVDRVRDEQEVYLIERGGTPVAQIGPVERRAGAVTMTQFKALVEHLAHPGDEYRDHVQRVVAKHNRPQPRRNPWAS